MKDFYQVGELAEFFGLSNDTIRLYDSMGIIPSSRGENNYRHFTRADLIALCYVVTLKEADLPLKEIHQMLNEGDLVASLDQLVKWRKEVTNRIDDLKSCKSRIDDYLENFQKAAFRLNTIRYERNTPILMRSLSADKNTMFDAIKRFSRLTREKTNVLSFILKKEILNTESLENFQATKYQLPMVLSMIDESNFVDGGSADLEGFEIYRHPLCAVGIVSTRTSTDYSHILRMYQRVSDMHTIVDDALMRVISVRNSIEKNLDYYEFWIPILSD